MKRLATRTLGAGVNCRLTAVAAVALVIMAGCEFGQSAKPGGVAQNAPPVVPPVEAGANSAAAKPGPAPDVTIPQGTTLRVRLSHAVSTDSNRPGDRFSATLDEPIMIGGMTVLPRGTDLRGAVKESDSSGRLRGRAVLALSLDSITLRGQNHPVRTGTYRRVSADHKKRNAVLMGGGSGVGALIGGLAGGGRGALIGAGAGAAAGTAGAAATGKREIRLPAEAVISFRLLEPLRIGS